MDRRVVVAFVGLYPLACGVSVAHAQIEDQLQAYTGRNATAYLSPLVEALGTDLNSGLFSSAYVPMGGFHARLEVTFTTAFFGEDSRYFVGNTEGGFAPQQFAEVPTVVGPAEAVWVSGDAGTAFAFPGGFDVDNFPVAVPLLRIGSWRGTEAVIRVFVLKTNDDLVQDVGLYGFGFRHSLSQYLVDGFPADLAFAGMWQRLSISDDGQGEFISSNAYSLALHASRTFGDITPYGGFAVDWFGMDLSYDVLTLDGPDTIGLSFDTGANVHYTFGFSYSIAFLNAFGEYNLANQNALSVGLAFQYTSSDRSVGP